MVRRRGVGPWTLEAFPAEIGRSSALIVTEDESLISTSVAASVSWAPRPFSLSPCSGVAAVSLPPCGGPVATPGPPRQRR